MRNFLRSWLGINKLEFVQEQEVKWRIEDSNVFRSRLYEHDKFVVKICEELNVIKNSLASFKLPPTERLNQLKGGLDILTKFANELQRDIDNAKV